VATADHTEGSFIETLLAFVRSCLPASASAPAMPGLRRAARILLVGLLLWIILAPGGAQAQVEDIRIRRIIDDMSVDERVGQLFLVTYMGQETGAGSDIARLIRDYKVGGVVLGPRHRNFRNAEGAPAFVAKVTSQLQSLALADTGPGVPLLIAIEEGQASDQPTALRRGITSVPSPLAVGATWSPDNARTVGEIVGRELSTLGVNLLLGPPLDVLLTPRPGQPGDLGTRSFGGSPYWVGEMGREYIAGVHTGSGNRMATVAQHFPGHGSSDRSPQQEAATVEKSLEEMVRADLVPFFEVTDLGGGRPEGVTDALMTSHLRYRGFQGPTRPGSPPISFDPGGLKVIMDLAPLAGWRESGLLVSDSLGVVAVRRHFSPSLDSFPHKEIAQKALLAGNDMLLASRFALTDEDWTTQYANLTSAIEFFREKYETDNTFKARVDEALVRVLRIKTRLYPDFDLATVGPNVSEVDTVLATPEAKTDVATIAQSAVALVAPGLQELVDRLPAAPRGGEPIIIFTDTRTQFDCPECPAYTSMRETALEEAILRLYGPDGTAQINPTDVHSFTYNDLKAFLQPLATEAGGQPSGPDVPSLTGEEQRRIANLLQNAVWVVFAMQDIRPDTYPASDALRVFLKEQANTLADKKLIVMAYSAPYYLDATEISKLTAYFAVFSRAPASIEASARALFQEFTPSRALPVSVPAITYDLAVQLQPRADQELSVTRVDAAEGVATVGQEYTVETSVIRDRNGNRVPDGTKVTLWLTDQTDSTYLSFKETKTVDGVARVTLVADRTGPLEIRAESGEAQTADPLALTVRGEPEPPAATVESLPPTATAEVVAMPSASPTAVAVPVAEAPLPPQAIGWATLLMSVVGMVGAGILTAAVDGGGERALSHTMRVFLVCLAAGLTGYVIVGLQWLQAHILPGLSSLAPEWRTPLLSTVFAFIPLVWVVWQARERAS
jgi:beta-N-acetylhexosaminidase